MGQSTYYVKRFHDDVVMKRDFMDIDNAIIYATECYIKSQHCASYEVYTEYDVLLCRIESVVR